MELDADVRWCWFRRTCTRRPRRRGVAKIKVLTGATADLASFTNVTPFTPPRILPPSRNDVRDRLATSWIGWRHVRTGSPRRLRNAGGSGPSLKGLSTIAWGWHGTCLPQVADPHTRLNSEGVGDRARGWRVVVTIDVQSPACMARHAHRRVAAIVGATSFARFPSNADAS